MEIPPIKSPEGFLYVLVGICYIAAGLALFVAAHERDSFDLILMDGQMPTMDGFEATAIIRDREETTGGHIPIVALTAHAMKGDRERFLGACMDAYLAKPFTPDQLVDVINQVVS
jgi:CheY-like chemotaxis protein